MTAHSDRYPQPSDHRPIEIDDPAATRDDSPRVAGDVPITVWRLDDRDGDQPATEPGAGFASRLARRLVLIYTRRGDTVVDFDHDTYLHGAASETSSCTTPPKPKPPTGPARPRRPRTVRSCTST